MRKKMLLFLLLAAVLVALLLSRCGAKKKTQETVPVAQSRTETAASVPQVNLSMGAVQALAEDAGIKVVTPNGEEHVYADVKADDWYVDALNYVVSNGFMSGVITADGEQMFHANYGMTRAQFAMILYRFAEGEPVEEPRSVYEDVPEYEWFYDCVNWVDTEGYLTALDSEHFGVNEYLTCEQVLIVFYRFAGRPDATASLEEYPYAAKVSEDSDAAIRWAWGTGLISEEECVWYPTQCISRAQIALLLLRYVQLPTAAE